MRRLLFRCCTWARNDEQVLRTLLQTVSKSQWERKVFNCPRNSINSLKLTSSRENRRQTTLTVLFGQNSTRKQLSFQLCSFFFLPLYVGTWELNAVALFGNNIFKSGYLLDEAYLQTAHKQPLLVCRCCPGRHARRRSSFHKTWAERHKG